MATDANSLLAEVTCYHCADSGGVAKLLELALLRQVLLVLDPMADTSVNGLLATVSCYNCLTPGQQSLLGLALLKQIIDSGGVVGGVIYGTADPVDAPPGDRGLFYRLDTGGVFIWNPTTDSWDPIIP